MNNIKSGASALHRNWPFTAPGVTRKACLLTTLGLLLMSSREWKLFAYSIKQLLCQKNITKYACIQEISSIFYLDHICKKLPSSI